MLLELFFSKTLETGVTCGTGTIRSDRGECGGDTMLEMTNGTLFELELMNINTQTNTQRRDIVRESNVLPVRGERGGDTM
jgi:hypothetical protein